MDSKTQLSRLDAQGASEYLRMHHGIKRAAGTLAKDRQRGTGPKFRKAGRCALYEIAHLDEFASGLLGEIVTPSSYEAGAS